jgi:hypothetical protein
MGVAGILPLHEDAVAAEDRGVTVTFDDLAVVEIDLRMNAQAADDPRDWIPRHLDEPGGLPLRHAVLLHTGPAGIIDEHSIGDVLIAWRRSLRCAGQSAARRITALTSTRADSITGDRPRSCTSICGPSVAEPLRHVTRFNAGTQRARRSQIILASSPAVSTVSALNVVLFQRLWRAMLVWRTLTCEQS